MLGSWLAKSKAVDQWKARSSANCWRGLGIIPVDFVYLEPVSDDVPSAAVASAIALKSLAVKACRDLFKQTARVAMVF